ncbi:hypothetical protein [Arthrobacter sp. JSM 101049]|uniref:hypothetical protein n=1 Tax=Arthrobacter sp. JSM 101049 TaxID=929097 RepID=UPI0035649291
MTETRQETSAASEALQRLRATQPATPTAAASADAAPSSNASPDDAPGKATQSTADGKAAPETTAPARVEHTGLPPKPLHAPEGTVDESAAASRHMAAPGTHGRVEDENATVRLNSWLDGLEAPNWKALAGRTRARARKAISAQRGNARRRAATREQARQEKSRTRAEREAAERAEADAAAERQRAAEEAARLAAEEAAAQQAAEEAAARKAASGADLESLVESAREAIVDAAAHPISRTSEELRNTSPYWVDDEGPIYVPPYNLPSRDPDPEETRQDLIRRVVVSATAVVSLILGFLGLGWFGGATAHSAADSPFRPRHALLAPGIDSFMIWGVLFIWIVLYAIYQWHPSQRSSYRQREIGYLTAGAGLLGALWLVCARASLVFVPVVLSLALAAVLVYAVRRMNQRTARSTLERVFVDGPAALYMGWALVLVPATLSIALTEAGVRLLLPASWWGVLAVVGCTWAATTLSMSERGRIVLALGYAWGLFWIMLDRLIGPLFSTPVALICGLCAFIVLLATENRRYQIGHAERRAARGQRTEF